MPSTTTSPAEVMVAPLGTSPITMMLQSSLVTTSPSARGRLMYTAGISSAGTLLLPLVVRASLAAAGLCCVDGVWFVTNGINGVDGRYMGRNMSWGMFTGKSTFHMQVPLSSLHHNTAGPIFWIVRITVLTRDVK